MASVLGAGLYLGGKGQQIIINYSKSKYDAKISELQGYIKELEGHQAKLESYEQQLFSAWNDANAAEYKIALQKQTKAVKNAINRAKSLKDIYQQASDALKNQKNVFQQTVEEVSKAIDTLGIGDD
ncbi:hypothetical protein [Sharpea azabuensis]|uniref:hypothetical protein n=1 Tax=Sharpea azabuensis TaxID=322505 RepID=UPI003D0316C0